MKSGTTEKLKFKKLQRRLKLKLWQCAGLLEMLWMFTTNNAPAGDIGRHSNEDIAAALEWEDDADALIEALIDTRWLNADDVHRLLVHDWEEHCPNYLKGGFTRAGKTFATQQTSEKKELSTENKDKKSSLATSLATSSELLATKPNQTKPSLANSNPTKELGRSDGVLKDKISVESLRDTGWLLGWLRAEGLRLRPPLIDNERNRIFVIAVAERAIEKASRNPGGFFAKLVRDEERGFIDQAQEDRAISRLRAYERNARGSPGNGIPSVSLRRAT
jgi:hypothetical protein